MLTEEEKYFRIDQLLKGKLSIQDEQELKESYSTDDFTFQIESHRLANEAVEEYHFLGLKAATKKIIKRKALNQKLKYTAGICIVTAGIVAWYFYKPIKEKETTKLITMQTKTVSNELNTIQFIEPAKPGAKKTNSIKSNKHNQTTNIITEISKLYEPTEMIPAEIFEDEDSKKLKTEDLSNKKAEIPSLNTISTITKTDNKAVQQDLKTVNESSELILNPDRNELITFTVEEDFEGEISVYNATGEIIFKQIVSQGKPNQWDGMMKSGGIAPSGQYGFVIKNHEGKELKQGFVTVLR